jgi:hypothetical protein
MNFLKVVDNVDYRGVLNPVHHSKKAFKLGNSNRTKFMRWEQCERRPPMQEPKAGILDINKSYPSSFTRNIIAKIKTIKVSHGLGFRQAVSSKIQELTKMGENQPDLFPETRENEPKDSHHAHISQKS